MKKRIFSVGIALCLTFTQIPVYAMSTFSDGSEEIAVFDSEPAFASESNVKGNDHLDEMTEENGYDEASITWNVFEENMEAAKESDYEINNGVLTIKSGKKVQIEETVLDSRSITRIVNYGTISGTCLSNIEIINKKSGEMVSGKYDTGNINGTVTNYGTISGGCYNNDIINYGTISGGVFCSMADSSCIIQNKTEGIISGGTFGRLTPMEGCGCTVNNNGTVSGGDFTYTVKITGINTVTFMNLDNTSYEIQRRANASATQPEDPTASEGKKFCGWAYQIDENAYAPYDFSTKVTEDITLYANWDCSLCHVDNNKDHYCDYGCGEKLSEHTPILRGYRSASCTSNGYSGDTYCSYCNEKLASGGVISAYGHKYDDGVITTEPTTEENGIKTYTCIRCKNTKTENLGRIGDGIPYLKGSFDKRGWDVLLMLIRDLKEGSGLSICMNGKTILPSEILAEVRGKDITLTLELENGFIWTINGASVTSEKLTDMDLAATWTSQNIPSVLIKKATGDDPYAELHLATPIDAGFTGNLLIAQGYETTKVLWANLFRYDPITGTLLCTQAVPNGDEMVFSFTQGYDYLIVYSSQYFVGTVIDTEDSAADEELQPDRAVIKSTSVDKNKLTVRMESGCKGAEGYDIVVGKKDILKTRDFRYVKYDLTSTKATFTYLPKGTWYIAGRAWRLDASGQKVYGSWSKVQKVKVTVKTPAQTNITKVNVEGSTVTVTYKKSKYADGYRIVLGQSKKTSNGESYPTEYTKATRKIVTGKDTVTVTFKNVKKGTYYLSVRSWNLSTGTSEKVYGSWSNKNS